MQVLSNITIDLASPGFTPILEGVQGDSARAVCMTLTENGKAWEIPEGVQVLLRYRNQNGRGGVFDALPSGELAYEISGNTLTLTLPTQVWGVPGRTRVQAVLTKEEKQLTVFSFELMCQSTDVGGQDAEYVNITKWLTERGIPPVKGVDYWTEADIAEIHDYIDIQLGVIEIGAY